MAKIKKLKQGPLGNINTSIGTEVYPITTSAAVYHATVAGGSENLLDDYLRGEAAKVANNTSSVNQAHLDISALRGRVNDLETVQNNLTTTVIPGLRNDVNALKTSVGYTTDTASSNTVWGNIKKLQGDVSNLSYETEQLASNLRNVEEALPNKASVQSVNDIIDKNLGENPNQPTPSPHGLKYRTAWDCIQDIDEQIGQQPESTDLTLWESNSLLNKEIGENPIGYIEGDVPGRTYNSIWMNVGENPNPIYRDPLSPINNPRYKFNTVWDNIGNKNSNIGTLWGNITSLNIHKADLDLIDTAIALVNQTLSVETTTLAEALGAIINYRS